MQRGNLEQSMPYLLLCYSQTNDLLNEICGGWFDV